MTGLRRPEKEIKDKAEVERILTEAKVGRLGTSSDGRPYVVPLSFTYHDRKIVIHGAKIGKKMENIARNPRVCFEVDTSEIIPCARGLDDWIQDQKSRWQCVFCP
jgi:hypothetical protein